MIENKTGPTEMLSSNPNVIPLSRASSMIQNTKLELRSTKDRYLLPILVRVVLIDDTIIIFKISVPLFITSYFVPIFRAFHFPKISSTLPAFFLSSLLEIYAGFPAFPLVP